jgi:hypothetical protein
MHTCLVVLASEPFGAIAIDALSDGADYVREPARLRCFELIPGAVLRGFDRQCERRLVVACARGVAYPADALDSHELGSSTALMKRRPCTVADATQSLERGPQSRIAIRHEHCRGRVYTAEGFARIDGSPRARGPPLRVFRWKRLCGASIIRCRTGVHGD